MLRALFPGSFDPVTNGHLDLIGRLCPLVDQLVVGVAVNPGKQPLLSDTERVALLREACRAWPQVEVQAFNGLVVEAARRLDVQLLVRGIRNGEEFNREWQLAQMNRALTGIETLLMPTTPQWALVSSSLIKEVARFGGDVSAFVPPAVAARLRMSYP